MFLESDRKQQPRVISFFAGMPPPAIRAWCSWFRYCPDPLGIVTSVYIRSSPIAPKGALFYTLGPIKNGQPIGRPT